ncbi:helix-turn-helix domain-containing protein [Faecalibacterium prausnitzii]|jgi:transcriptional regulator with XRE-family HTH domain|uniref:Transcriptional regulator n=1 Tax=Faecalibacterium prausnitzii TaxID=853 RepID=A0A2A7ANA4_9FIRM|nr:helix-turn-helix transcriptional regulator [Faecalibacterium prausnitzii]PDX80596.1 transcriptional regulator [Faecalibacterium prausnitzii]
MRINQNRLKDLREDHDYTQQQVAEKIGITQRKYSYIETGVQQLTADVLVALARFYKVSVDYLLGETDVTVRYPESERE